MRKLATSASQLLPNVWSFLHTGIRRESCIRGVLNFRSNSGTVRRMRIQTPLPSRMSDFRRRRRLLSPLRCTYASLRRQYHHALGEKTHFSPSTKGSIVSFAVDFVSSLCSFFLISVCQILAGILFWLSWSSTVQVKFRQNHVDFTAFAEREEWGRDTFDFVFAFTTTRKTHSSRRTKTSPD